MVKKLCKAFLVYTVTLYLAGCGAKADANTGREPTIEAKSVLDRSEEIIIDGEVEVDLDRDGVVAEKIIYSVSRVAPAPTCGPETSCESSVEPVLSWSVLVKGETIYSDYLCAKISISDSITRGMSDIFCGDNLKLVWNGRRYGESVD